MADDPFLIGRRESNHWEPVVALNCPEHGVHMTRESYEMFGSVWRCPEEGCSTRVFVEVDRERLDRIARDLSRR